MQLIGLKTHKLTVDLMMRSMATIGDGAERTVANSDELFRKGTEKFLGLLPPLHLRLLRDDLLYVALLLDFSLVQAVA
jgi:hypothetical protein